MVSPPAAVRTETGAVKVEQAATGSPFNSKEPVGDHTPRREDTRDGVTGTQRGAVKDRRSDGDLPKTPDVKMTEGKEEKSASSPQPQSGSASPRRHCAVRDDESVGGESVGHGDDDFDEPHARNAESEEDDDTEAANPNKLATAEPLVVASPQDKMRALRSCVRRLVRERRELRAQLRRGRASLEAELRDLAQRNGIKPPVSPPKVAATEEDTIAKEEDDDTSKIDQSKTLTNSKEAAAEATMLGATAAGDSKSPSGKASDGVKDEQEQEKGGAEASRDDEEPGTPGVDQQSATGGKRRRISQGEAAAAEGPESGESNGTVVAASEPQRKRPRLEEADPLQRQRSRNLFGRLMGHLQRAKETLEKEKDSRQNELQTAASQRIAEKLTKDKEYLRAAKLKKLMTENESLRTRLRKLNWEIEVAETQHLRCQLEAHYSNMQNFISTRAQPTIFWTPNVHTAGTRELQSQMSHDIEAKISKIAQQIASPTFEEFCQHQDATRESILAAYEEYRRELREKHQQDVSTNPNGPGAGAVGATATATRPVRRYRNPDDDEEDEDHDMGDSGDEHPAPAGNVRSSVGGGASGRWANSSGRSGQRDSEGDHRRPYGSPYVEHDYRSNCPPGGRRQYGSGNNPGGPRRPSEFSGQPSGSRPQFNSPPAIGTSQPQHSVADHQSVPSRRSGSTRFDVAPSSSGRDSDFVKQLRREAEAGASGRAAVAASRGIPSKSRMRDEDEDEEYRRRPDGNDGNESRRYQSRSRGDEAEDTRVGADDEEHPPEVSMRVAAGGDGNAAQSRAHGSRGSRQDEYGNGDRNRRQHRRRESHREEGDAQGRWRDDRDEHDPEDGSRPSTLRSREASRDLAQGSRNRWESPSPRRQGGSSHRRSPSPTRRGGASHRRSPSPRGRR